MKAYVPSWQRDRWACICGTTCLENLHTLPFCPRITLMFHEDNVNAGNIAGEESQKKLGRQGSVAKADKPALPLRASWLQKSPVVWGTFCSAGWREESHLPFYLSHCAVETSNKKILWAPSTTQYESQPSVMSRVKLIILEDIQSCCCYSKGWVDKDSIHIFVSFRRLCGREVGQRAWRRKYKSSMWNL